MKKYYEAYMGEGQNPSVGDVVKGLIDELSEAKKRIAELEKEVERWSDGMKPKQANNL